MGFPSPLADTFTSDARLHRLRDHLQKVTEGKESVHECRCFSVDSALKFMEEQQNREVCVKVL